MGFCLHYFVLRFLGSFVVADPSVITLPCIIIHSIHFFSRTIHAKSDNIQLIEHLKPYKSITIENCSVQKRGSFALSVIQDNGCKEPA